MSLLQFSDAIGLQVVTVVICWVKSFVLLPNTGQKLCYVYSFRRRGVGASYFWRKSWKENPLQSKTGSWKLETWKEEEKDLPLIWALKALLLCLLSSPPMGDKSTHCMMLRGASHFRHAVLHGCINLFSLELIPTSCVVIQSANASARLLFS